MSRPPRVLVTRSPHQASALADALRTRGAEPVLVPTIDIAPPESFAALDAALGRLAEFDWLVLTSGNAVDVLRARLDSMGLRWTEMPTWPRVAAIGAATARALQLSGMEADLVPPRAVAESLAEALLPFAASGRFLLVRGEQGRDVLPETLRAAGGTVEIGVAYRTVAPPGSAERLHELFAPGSPDMPDAVTFTSSSSVHNLLELCSSAGVVLPEGVLRASIGPVTSAALRDSGYPPHTEAAEADVESLADVLMVAWSFRNIR